ncbi:MAG: cupin domain-containing protein [Acidobacteria bacterium]|nr:cupin domain-containing protein [Acidobacteriota bacterium]MBI3424447.1 cupin domain-containing protein [Acidobacteriota bacterium]
MNSLPINTDDAETSGTTSETLLRTSSSWNNVPYQAYAAGSPELVVRKITIPARGVLRWHEHPMPTAAYVLSGEITVEEPDGKQQHFTAGQVIPEPVNTVHRGIVGDTDAVFIVFYAGVKEMPLAKGT